MYMTARRHFLNFNKQLLFGELGSIIGAPTTAFIASNFTTNAAVISYSAVFGAIFVGCFSWIFARVIHRKKYGTLYSGNFTEDILYFTPAALIATLLFYYPTIYFVSKYLILRGDRITYSVLASQAIGFFFFVIVINTYRQILIKFFGKRL